MRGLIAFVLLVSALYGQELTFEEVKQAVTVKADETRLIVYFKFSNDSEEIAEIINYDAKCPCLAVQIEGGKLRYAPGEKGVMRGVFELQNFTGVVAKNIQIWMKGDAESLPSVKLSVAVTIPEKLHLEPASLSWQLGEETIEKSIMIKVSGDEPMEVLGVVGGEGKFSHTLHEVEKSKLYRLDIKPISTDTIGMVRLRVKTSSTNFRFAKRSVFVMVRK